MLSILGSTRIYVCHAATDMRCSFEGLSYRAREVVKEDPQSGHLFLFLNRTRDKLKILYFDRSGYAIWYKELQRGTFSCPEKRELTSGELMCLLEGIEIAGIRRKKRYFARISAAQSAPL
jgi:transposase